MRHEVWRSSEFQAHNTGSAASNCHINLSEISDKSHLDDRVSLHFAPLGEESSLSQHRHCGRLWIFSPIVALNNPV